MSKLKELENERNEYIKEVNDIDEQKRSIKDRLTTLKNTNKLTKEENDKARHKYRMLTDRRAEVITCIGELKKEIKSIRNSELENLRIKEKAYIDMFMDLGICPKNINDGVCIQPLDFECTNKEHSAKCLKQYAMEIGENIQYNK